MTRRGGASGEAEVTSKEVRSQQKTVTSGRLEEDELNLDLILYPVYLRGEAHLAAHQGAAAGDEFQKILDHVVVNEPIGALAHLGLGRAYALEARTPGSAGGPTSVGSGPQDVPPASRKQQTAGKARPENSEGIPALPGDARA